MNVVGPLRIDSAVANGIDNGTIAAKGDVTVTTMSTSGSAKLQIAGSANQAVSFAAAANVPNLEFASTGGTVSVSGTANVFSSFTYLSGTINWGTSVLVLSTGTSLPIVIEPGSAIYGAVTFAGSGSFSGIDLSSKTMSIGGLLTINTGSGNGISNGTLDARGNVSLVANTTSGNAAISFTGSNAQTIGRTAGNWPTGAKTVNKSGGSVTQTSAISFTGSGLSVVAGPWFMSGYALTVPSLTLNSNTLTKGTGVLTVGGVAAGTGSLYGGTVAP